ncbi:MAG: UvrD-helicase domain-containing protein [Puniceicoccales bacterium]|jgi:superfamily I DNA/RNA helicase|nr:UvrD-helicase domain-containing protein [Puniceicoccales bacterium]
MNLSDQYMRQRFIGEHGTNFSVIAPAGVGKTTAIAQRVASIVHGKKILLHKLILVTYTQKSALELQQRTLWEVQKNGDDLSAFGRIFFGTIHGFADQLLRRYGHFIGLDPDFEIEGKEQYLWEKFLKSFQEEHPFKGDKLGMPLDRESLYNLVARFPDSGIDVAKFCPEPPPIDLAPLLNYPTGNHNIIQFQNHLRRWEQNPTLPFPKITTKAEAFSRLYNDVMAPFEDWCSALYGQNFLRIQTAYAIFRFQEKRLNFSDLIRLSLRLLDHPGSGASVRGHYVILDEAQDTDPQQFQLLLAVAQSPGTANPDYFQNPPPGGHYSMVGDPQQSIYLDRANVTFYQKLHQTLTENSTVEALVFPVTLRFGPRIAENINRSLGNILDGKDQQVPFVPILSGLNPNLSDKCHRTDWFRISTDGDKDDPTFLKQFFQGRNPEDFDVKKWSDIAILCPRRAWLEEIEEAFLKTPSLPEIQLHSATKIYGEYRQFAWIQALVGLMINPKNQFEFSGILREIFGISDSLIARHYRDSPVDEIAIVEEKIGHWYRECQYLSPLQVIKFLSQRLEIKARMEAMEDKFDGEIEKILYRGAASCESLLQYAQYLEKQSKEVFQSDHGNENALQLYTFHKAKGLEWPVVILPFLNRKQTPAPHILPEVIGGKIAISERQRYQWTDPNDTIHNNERLLYVALTRQKQQTIFLDNGREPDQFSTAAILQSAPGNKNLIKNLPPFRFPEKTNRETSTLSPQNPSPIIFYQYSDPKQRHCFPLLTSKRPRSSPPIPFVQGKDMDARNSCYGNWWRRTMQQCPFKSREAIPFLRSTITATPHGDLAKKDVEKLINNTFFWQQIGAYEEIFSPYPFFVVDHGRILEGRIDLLFKRQHCLHIMVWETEYIADVDIFLKKHGHSMENHRVALKQLFPRYRIGSSIYATESGKLFPMD